MKTEPEKQSDFSRGFQKIDDSGDIGREGIICFENLTKIIKS